MNRLQGDIAGIRVKDQLSLIDIELPGVRFQVIVIDTPETDPHLRVGTSVNLLFKETEVILSKADPGTHSVANAVEGQIDRIEDGELLSRVFLICRCGPITAVISKDAVKMLDLKTGSKVFALVQINEIMLSF